MSHLGGPTSERDQVRVLWWLRVEGSCAATSLGHDITQKNIRAVSSTFPYTQEGAELLPFLEGLSPLAARLPAREASSAAQHLEAMAAPHRPIGGASELPCFKSRGLMQPDLSSRAVCLAITSLFWSAS